MLRGTVPMTIYFSDFLQSYFGLLGLCGPPTHLHWCWLREQSELPQSRASVLQEGGGSLQPMRTEVLWAGLLWQDPPSFGRWRTIPRLGSLWWWLPLSSAPCPPFLVTGVSQWERLVSGLEGEDKGFLCCSQSADFPTGPPCWCCQASEC